MRILVTGASGFIGRAFLRALAGHDVLGSFRTRTQPGLVRLDLREPEALRQCLEKLPPRQRAMLVQRYEGQQSFEQISRTAGSTPGAVQRALSRIRMALHDCVLATLRASQERR